LQIDINEIKKSLKKHFTKDRFEHTLSVMETAVILAERFGADLEKARIAGLLHDIAKEKTIDKLLEICNLYEYKPDEFSMNSINLLHGPVGALIIRNEYGIMDQDIFSSVFFHTTAKEDMSILDKVIYVADKIEPLNCFDGIDIMRHEAITNIDKVLLMLIKKGIKRVLDREDIPHPNTIEAEKYYNRRNLI
jgi:predicted HD superfamily hydrolase involved in NAD metabolism